MIPQEILNLGAVAILFFLFMKEFFGYLKIKQNNKNGDKEDKTIEECQKNMAKIELQLSNHLDHVKGDISGIQTDVKIMRNDLDEIKMILKK